jgi:RNA polymerase sigma factor (sigma-70 family)
MRSAAPARPSSRLGLAEDAWLVVRCRAGEDEAWRALVARHSRCVYAIAKRGFRLPDADAEDVFQEVFARAYEHLGRLRDPAAVGPWLGQLARRLSIDRLRRRQREAPVEDAGLETVAEWTMAVVDDALTVEAALRTLPASHREVVERFFLCDESYAQISAALGLPPGTVASRISRSLERMRSTLEAAPDARAA